LGLGLSVLLAFWCLDGSANADGPAPSASPASPTTLVCRDREDPSVGATLVFDLARKLLVSSSGVGDTILFGDRDVPVRVDAASVEWEVAHNTYTLNRATLELDVIGRVYMCQLAPRQL
jgi:hypothetical protein